MNLLNEFFLLFLLLLAIGQSGSWAVTAAIQLSKRVGLSEFITSLFLVTTISILPETLVSVISAINGVPEIGFGTLLGSNVADLTFVFGMVALLAPNALRVESRFIKNDYLFLSFLILPLLLGINGHYSRLDGILLIFGSVVFLYTLIRQDGSIKKRNRVKTATPALRYILALMASVLIMGVSAYYAVTHATRIAEAFSITPALIGLLVIALGTTLPELIFSVRAARKEHDTLAFGDILGTVIIDITFVLGLTALIHPFSFNPRLVMITGLFMLLAGLFTLSLLRSDQKLTKTEGALLLVFYAIFVTIEFMLRNWNPFG